MTALPGDDIADPIDALAPDAPLLVLSSGLRAFPHLTALLGGRPIAAAREAGRCAAALAWGGRAPYVRAARLAARHDLPLLRIEDAFFRSVGLGKEGAPPVGVVVDHIGLFFDARQPSRLEHLLRSRAVIEPSLTGRARGAIERVVSERISKYNTGLDAGPLPSRGDRGSVLIVDQVRGDRSIAGAGATAQTFRHMLATALATFPASRILVRLHPDVSGGHASGYLAGEAKRLKLNVLAGDLSAHSVLDRAEAVWTVSSQTGFEALLRGKSITTFGMPFYAGWGLTDDRADGDVAAEARRRRAISRDIVALFAGAAILYARYVDPVTKRPVSLERALDRLVDWRRRLREVAGATTYVYGFSRWKQQTARTFLGGTQAPVVRRRRWTPPAEVTAASRIAVWGLRDPPGFEAACRDLGHGFLRVEDGFVRSVGLGSDLVAAGSLVFDPVGIYYDADRPSTIETMIESGEVNDALRVRARNVRERLVGAGLTKYNLEAATPDLRRDAGGRPVVLVAGQVPGDMSMLRGAGTFSDSLSLVRAARQARPDAFLVYKEHPDVVAGNRRGHRQGAEIAAIADRVLVQGDAARLLAQCDEVHVISSLLGFEALLRAVPVVCWGRPFYAGWGLTRDRVPLPRRRRAIDLDTLVAAALIAYPRYADPLTAIPCSVEDYLDALIEARRRGPPRRELLSVRQLMRFTRWLFGSAAR